MGVFAAERLPARALGPWWTPWTREHGWRNWGMREWYVLTYIVGALFVAGQVYEYAELVHEGLSIASNGYGSVFYLTTGFHGLHVTGGLIAFLLHHRPQLRGQAVRPRRGHERDRDVVLLAFRRRRLDRPVPRHLRDPVTLHRGPRARRTQAGTQTQERRIVTALAARRRHPLATAVLVLLGLIVTGAAYAAAAARAGRRVADRVGRRRGRSQAVPRELLDLPRHQRRGPQQRAVPHRRRRGGGRLPGRHRPDAAAAERPAGAAEAPCELTEERDPPARGLHREPRPGPSIPTPDEYSPEGGDVSRGGLIFRTNCAMCHNFAGQGRRPDPRQVRAEPRRASSPSTSTRRWSPARSRCRCSTT